MASLTSVITNPTVVAALFTAAALLVQNWASGRRENKRERERQVHAERMAFLANETARDVRHESARRERQSQNALNLSTACTDALFLLHDRDNRLRWILAAYATRDLRRMDELLLDFAATRVDALSVMSRLSLLDDELGANCESLIQFQHDLAAEYGADATGTLDDSKYKSNLRAIGEFTSLSRSKIRAARSDVPAATPDVLCQSDK